MRRRFHHHTQESNRPPSIVKKLNILLVISSIWLAALRQIFHIYRKHWSLQRHIHLNGVVIHGSRPWFTFESRSWRELIAPRDIKCNLQCFKCSFIRMSAMQGFHRQKFNIWYENYLQRSPCCLLLGIIQWCPFPCLNLSALLWPQPYQ